MIFEAQMAFPTKENEQQCIRDCVEQAVFAEQMASIGCGRSSITA